MRWPWNKPEQRQSGGDFSDAVVRLLETQAAGTAADAGGTAALEAASGALRRAFASAKVQGDSMVKATVTPKYLAQVGRDLIRSGDSLHVIKVERTGRVRLLPASDWHFEGSGDPDSWTVRATYYGPSDSTTKYVPFSGVVFLTWGSTPGQPYIGTAPMQWANLTSRLLGQTERSLADEMSGPLAQILTIPADGGDGEDTDPLAMLKADIARARGKAILLETTQAGYGDGRSAAPQRDWRPTRLGPMPPESMALIRDAAFNSVLAATGTPPALFIDSDGASQREALRRWHFNVVLPMARLLEAELSEKLEADVGLHFDNYALDLVGRSNAFAKLKDSGYSAQQAEDITGLMVA